MTSDRGTTIDWPREKEVYRNEGDLCRTPSLAYLAATQPDSAKCPTPLCHAFKTANKASENPRLATLSMLPLKRRPSWNSPCIRPACPLIVPPWMPPIHMPFRATPRAQLRALIVLGWLSDSHIANGCGRGWWP